ncbi:MAG: 2-C-methyl-D-erythritol 4-phosphate cytidylyltransferase [Eubacteriales bacterium]
MRKGAIILAAGQGTRCNRKKQFLELDHKTLWKHVYDKTREILDNDNIIVVGVDIEGGNTRTQSVMKGLQNLDVLTERVIILEAARPLVTLEQVRILLEDEQESVAFVSPLTNTVMQRDGGYLNREELYELLTPQAFSYPLLLEAYESGEFSDMTDETRVMFEYHKIKPKLIETGQNLLKVTYPEDIAIIELLYQRQKEEK